MNYYIIAGEKSGDIHGANLMKNLKLYDPEARFRFWGGDDMIAQGGDLVTHYKEMSFMGFLEVLYNIDKILKFLSLCQKDLLSYSPDVLILIDYSGFNMQIAKFAKKNKIKTFYYISPKVWAWNTRRAISIKNTIDKMFVILPFEKDFYKKYDYEVDYVGNPTLDAIQNHVPNKNFRQHNHLDDRPIIAVLPGSRKQEIEHMLHFMVSILPAFPDYQFVVAGVAHLDQKYYNAFKRKGRVEIVYEQTYDLLQNAKVAVVTSGTATLETALFKVPQVVCYNTSTLTYLIARLLVKIKYISLVNLIAKQKIVQELIQDEFSPVNIVLELNKILQDDAYRNKMLVGYENIIKMLGNPGASNYTAQLMVKYLNNRDK